MDTEEKLLGLMAIVEEQQETIKQLTANSEANTTKQHNQLAQQQNQLAEQHRKVIQEYGGLFKEHISELSERGKRWLNWKFMTGSIAVTVVVCLFMLGGAWLYLDYLVNDIYQAQASQAGLKAYHADIRDCGKDGKPYKCIRVKESWGRYMVGSKPYYIIDPK